MLYLFVLGRDYELSKVEVESVFERKKIPFKTLDENKDMLLVETGKIKPEFIQEFGGVIKIAEVISNTDRHDEIEYNLEKANLYSGTENKIEYYIATQSTNLLSFVEDCLKDYFKSLKLKALYRSHSEPSKLVNKNILKMGVDLVIFKNIIGKTITIFDPREFKKRDLGRPEVDYMKVISIRLAKILVNISKVKDDELLMDPFSGSGTILQEALLKDVNVVGLDNDSSAVQQAKKNLDWLSNNYKIKSNYKIVNLDCTKLINAVKENTIDAVVTEPYMGPYIRKLPTMAEARQLVTELSSLYNQLMANVSKVLKKNGRVVIIMPKFRTRENRTLFLDFKSIAERNGFYLANKPINYGYKESKLLREIYVLEKK